MHELHGGDVVEEVLPPGLEHQDLGRHEVAVHQREGVIGVAGAQPGDEAAAERHDEDECGEPQRGTAEAPARRRVRRQQAQRDPQLGGEDRRARAPGAR